MKEKNPINIYPFKLVQALTMLQHPPPLKSFTSCGDEWVECSLNQLYTKAHHAGP